MDDAITQILEAAASHDVKELQELLNMLNFPDCASVDVLDPATGKCPLHCAIESCAPKNGVQDASENQQQQLIDRASETVRLLLENGAIWNQLDLHNETPGCVAWRLGLEDLYQLMVDAGVRAELLLNRLDGYEQLDDEDMDELEEAPVLVDVIQDNVNTATASQDKPAAVDVNSDQYLSSVLSFDKDKILDDQSNGVMMEWEREIMRRSAEAIIDRPGLKILNIGAGMLIFDSIVQGFEAKPSQHHIIEAHPDVLANMQASGWLEKPGVVVHAGRWQDILPSLVVDNETYDAIFFDTFAESYTDFKEFFCEHVIGLLNQNGRWSFFNGMGADRQISYDVYQKVVEMDLFEAGFDIEWHEIDVPTLDKEWEGVKRKYWSIAKYRLPVCKFME